MNVTPPPTIQPEHNYKKGKEMFLVDTLSRAFTPEANVSAFVQELEQIDHKSTLPVSEARWHQIKQASADDPVFQELCMVIQRGWPSKRKAVPECLYPYFDIRDELTIEDELVFKGHQLVSSWSKPLFAGN